MGLLKFSPRGWDIAHSLFKNLSKEQQDKLDMTSLLSLLLKKIEIKVSFVHGGWCEVDSYEDVILYEKLLKNKNWKHNWIEK